MGNELVMNIVWLSLVATGEHSGPSDSISHNIFNESGKPPISFTTFRNCLHEIRLSYYAHKSNSTS